MDVFYFNSASEPIPRSEGRHLKRSGKPSAKRRKIRAVMDASSYHAHVVRVAEPTVVANDLSSLSSQYLEALLDAGFSPSSLTLPQIRSDGQLLSNSSAPKLDEQPQANPPVTLNEASATTLNASSAPDTTIGHPRPESSDLWEDEDSRRIRFALEDGNDDHVDRLRHSYTAPTPFQVDSAVRIPELAISRGTSQQWPPRALTETDARPRFISDTQRTAASFFEWFDIRLPPPPPLQFLSASQFVPDDNILPVDDHQRSYDFADFMDQWIARSRHDDTLPVCKPVAGPSLWRRPQREYLRSDVEHSRGETDVQGLRWWDFGLERTSALKARRTLHPQRLGVKDEYSEDNDTQGLHYKPRTFAPKHRARYSHYQLRNMTATGSGRDVYYAAGSQVKRASLSCLSAEQTSMDLAKPSRSALPFKISCLAISGSSSRWDQDQVLVAGGFNGEYAMLNLGSAVVTKPIEGIVSHARDGIVNHINTFSDRRSATPQATFSSNDHSFRIMDLSRQHFTNRFTYDSAINCSTMSPDTRLRALVHDGLDTLITNAETGEVLVNLEAHTDFAFACDWSPCGRYLATAAEDHQVILWDARNWTRPLHKLDSVMSCARSLHFTDDGALVIAESEDVVSIVDTASFALRQDIRFFGSVAGISLITGGSEMVVANADETVGGLMSFERVSKGRGSGGFGQMVDPGGKWAKRRREYEGAVVDVLV